MALKEFLYFITDNDGNTYAVRDGNIVITPSPAPLIRSPDGWQETTLQYGRNSKYHGVFRTFTESLGFVKDGAHIIRYLYYSNFIEAPGNLVIAKLDPKTMVHKRYYRGALNLSQVLDDVDKINVEVTEGGLSMMIKANEDTKYEIPVDVPEAVNLKMDGLLIKANAAFAIQEGDASEGVTLLGCLFINSEGTFKDIVFNSAYNFISSGSTIPPVGPDSAYYVIRNDGQSIVFNLKFKYSVTRSLNGAHAVYFHVSNGTSFISSQEVFFALMDGGSVLNVEFEHSLSLMDGERLFISVLGTGTTDHFVYLPGGTLNVTFDFRYRQTLCKCLQPAYVFSKLIEKITDGKYTATSNFLLGEAEDFVITCGDAIRGISGAKIKTSLSDFFKSYNTRFNIGLGVKADIASIERKSTFYNQNIIADLGEVSDLQISPALEHLFNTLKIGWPAQNYDDVNGRDEFNNTHIYTTPIKRISKELDLTAPYRTDAYGIEFTRINLDGKITTDNSSDNDVFIINIADDGDGGFVLNRPSYSDISGVIAGATIFNVELSPKRCVIAHGEDLHVGLYKQDAGYLTFQTTEKNDGLSTTLNGITIAEKANVLIADLEQALFLPHVFQFNCKVPLNIVDMMESDPYGKIEFKWKGDTFRGYLVEVAQQPATDAAQTFKLLASTDTDMTKLIHG